MLHKGGFMRKGLLLLFAIAGFSLSSCTFHGVEAKEKSSQTSPIQNAYGEYQLINSKIDRDDSAFEYYQIEIKANNVLSSKYKVVNGEGKEFESKFSYCKYEKDYYVSDNKFEIILDNYDTIFPLVNWANIVLNMGEKNQEVTLNIQTVGMTGDGDIWYMNFKKANN